MPQSHTLRSRKTILVADDEPVLRQLLQLSLRQVGYDVLAAENGEQALALFRDHQEEIGAATLGWRMPRMDGPHAGRALPQLNPRVPFCFMTGGSLVYSREDLLGFGAKEVFSEPFEFNKITHTLEGLTDEEELVPA